MTKLSDRLSYFSKIFKRSIDMKNVAAATGKVDNSGTIADDVVYVKREKTPVYIGERYEKNIIESAKQNTDIITDVNIQHRVEKVAKGHFGGENPFFINTVVDNALFIVAVSGWSGKGTLLKQTYNTETSAWETNEGPYDDGTTVKVTFTADATHRFVRWEDDETASASREVTISSSNIYLKVIAEEQPVPTVTPYLTFEGDSSEFMELGLYDGANVEISDDAITWSDWNLESHAVSNGKVYVRAKTGSTPMYYFWGNFTKVSGPLMSLVDYENMETATLSEYQFFHNGGESDWCGLFTDNSYLEDASGLIFPSTTSEGCYCYMFSGCNYLEDASFSLPATTAEMGCYVNMFNYCTALTSAPTISATSLGTYCCLSMFNSCYSLETAPELPSLVLSNGCYSQMFYNCISLTSITCLATDIEADECTYAWVYGVSPESEPTEGTFHCNATTWANWEIGNDGIPLGWSCPEGPQVTVTVTATNCSVIGGGQHLQGSSVTLTATPSEGYGLIESCWTFPSGITPTYSESFTKATFTASSNCEVSVTALQLPEWNGLTFTLKSGTFDENLISFEQRGTFSGTWPIMYSVDRGLTWESYTVSSSTNPINFNGVGSKIYFAGTKDSTSGSTNNYRRFLIKGDVDISGDISSLLSFDSSTHTYTTVSDLSNYGTHLFYSLFNYYTSLTVNYLTAGNLLLPATTLTSYCYCKMFYGCTTLTTVPATLPATTLTNSVYEEMFYGCTSIVDAPELCAQDLNSSCYKEMFYGCTKLTGPIVIRTTWAISDLYVAMMFTNSGTGRVDPAMIGTIKVGNTGTSWETSAGIDTNYWAIESL